MANFTFEAIGTTWHIDVYEEAHGPLGKAGEAELLEHIMARIDLFDKAYSRFRSDSLVTEISRKAGNYELPADADIMLSLYYDLYNRTDGLVTPLIGDLISDAGYDATYSLQQKKELRKPPAWKDAIQYQPASERDAAGSEKKPTLNIKKPVLLDFGAAGKGYLVDLVGKVLEENGVRGYCIDAGGDILHKAGKSHAENSQAGRNSAIRIGLENPFDTKQVVGVSDLGDASICGSAGNRRKWGKFTHIMNPKTLESPMEIAAVWVVAKTAIIADALATCLFFVSPDSLSPAYEFEYAIVRSDHSFEKSAMFPGELFMSPA